MQYKEAVDQIPLENVNTAAGEYSVEEQVKAAPHLSGDENTMRLEIFLRPAPVDRLRAILEQMATRGKAKT
jgi:hypothetical protein